MNRNNNSIIFKTTTGQKFSNFMLSPCLSFRASENVEPLPPSAMSASSIKHILYPFIIFTFLILLTACGGGDSDLDSNEEPVPVSTGDSAVNEAEDENSTSDESTINEGSTEADESQNTSTDIIYTEADDVARFLTQATFGPRLNEINALTNKSISQWFTEQIAKEPSYLLPVFSEMSKTSTSDEELSFLEIESTTIGFWRNAITGQDQLRQRMAFALSELLVVSNGGGEELTDVPSAVAYFQDLLIEHAFGNYRDILEAVTYSPAMGYYLTYQGSEKGDPVTGRMPDENYARELLQLFTIGVVELNMDGTPKLDTNGNVIETYDNKDITGLAKVFTGMNLNEIVIEESVFTAYATPMVTFEESHSLKEKNFLNFTIAAGTSADASISQALDHIFFHPNIAPFVSSHIIQRLVMSNPSPEYVGRVANAFTLGEFTLPNGKKVGKSKRGDLAATLAAVLFDTEARNIQGITAGKIREPILRFTHWARAFNIEAVTPEFQELLWDTGSSSSLGQHPYRSPSVFNFFRPGYIAPGTLSAKHGLKAPEFQIVNASSVAGYTNFITYFILLDGNSVDLADVQSFFSDEGVSLDFTNAPQSFVAKYEVELGLINNQEKLIDHLDLLLTYGTLSKQTRSYILSTLNKLPEDSQDNGLYKIQLAVLLIMTSPDYLIQQ